MLRGFGGFAIGSLLTDGGGCLGQHGSLQLHAGPYLGHARLRWQLRRGRRTWCPGSVRSLRGSWHPRHLHSGDCGLSRRRRCGRSVTRTFDFVSFDHRLAQRLDLHGRSSWCGGSPGAALGADAATPGGGIGITLASFCVIEDDGLLRGGIGDNAGRGDGNNACFPSLERHSRDADCVGCPPPAGCVLLAHSEHDGGAGAVFA